MPGCSFRKQQSKIRPTNPERSTCEGFGLEIGGWGWVTYGNAAPVGVVALSYVGGPEEEPESEKT